MKQHTAGEDYLKTILLLEQEQGTVRSVDVAGRMNVTKPSVSYAVTVLKESNLLMVDDNMYLHLTDAGRKIAEQVYRRYCFFTELLMDSGVSRDEAAADACRLEHAISEDSFQKLRKNLKHQNSPSV